MDPVKFLASLSAGQAGSRLRLGMARVRSVDTDGVLSITTGQAVIIPSTVEIGTTAIVANYMGEYPPRPGGSVWYVTDGVDRIILGMMAPDGPPTASISLTAATATTTATNCTAVMTTINYDPWNMAYTGSTALQIPADGLYDFQAYAVWAANATGFRQIGLRKNGVALNTDRMPTTAAGNPAHSVEVMGLPCVKGDLISAIAQQTSTGNLNLNTFTLTANYVGRRRGTAASELLTDGGFEANNISPDGAWELFYASSASWSLDTSPNTSGAASTFSLKGVTPAGTSSQGVTSFNVLPVYPGQIIRVTGQVKTSAALAGNATNNVRFSLLCSASGTPNYFGGGGLYVPADGTVDGSLTATGTAFATITQDLTVPANCYVARVSLRSANTAGVTVWWDDISAKELIR